MLLGMQPTVPRMLPNVKYIGNASSAENGSVITFGGATFTVSEPCLLVCLAVCRGDQSRTFTAASIGGVSTPIDLQRPAAAQDRIIVTHRRVPAGSYSVSLTMSGTSGLVPGNVVHVFALNGIKDDTPSFTRVVNNSASPITVASTAPEDGVALFGYKLPDTSTSVTWSSASPPVAPVKVAGALLVGVATKVTARGYAAVDEAVSYATGGGYAAVLFTASWS